MKNQRHCRALLASLVVVGMAAAAQAQPVVTVVGGTDTTNGNWSLGWAFRANTNLSVTSLGFFDDLDDGLTESHDVGIFDINGTLLASATVNPGDTLINRFRYTTIAPLSLTAGNDYVISAVTGTENYNFQGAVTVSPSITFLEDRYISTGGALLFPTSTNNTTDAWFGPNFISGNAAAPEPTTVGLLGLGLGSLLVARRRKR